MAESDPAQNSQAPQPTPQPKDNKHKSGENPRAPAPGKLDNPASGSWVRLTAGQNVAPQHSFRLGATPLRSGRFMRLHPLQNRAIKLFILRMKPCLKLLQLRPLSRTQPPRILCLNQCLKPPRRRVRLRTQTRKNRLRNRILSLGRQRHHFCHRPVNRLRRLPAWPCPGPLAQNRFRHDNFRLTPSQAQPLQLAPAITKPLPLYTHAVQHRHKQIRHRRPLRITYMPPTLQPPIRTTSQNQRQVRMIM